MVELVKDDQRATSLSKDAVRHLWDLVETSKKKDRNFFDFCASLRKLFKTGTLDELQGLSEDEKVVINLAHSHVSSVLPTIFFQEPTVKATPTAPRYEGKHTIWESVLNNTNSKVGLKTEAKKAVLDALVYPEGWLKVLQNKVEEDEDGTQEGTTGETGKRGEVPWLSLGAPVFARVSPMQVIVDYRSQSRSLDSARFVDFVYLKDWNELKADDRYTIDEKTAAMKLRDEKLSITDGFIDPFAEQTQGGGTETLHSSKFDEYVELHEIWVSQIVDLKLKRHLIVLVSGKDGLITEKPIRFETWEEALGEHVQEYPFERLVFHEVPDGLPNSELGVWSSISAAINWLMSRMISFVENERNIYEVVESGLIDQDATKALFENGKPRTYIKVNAAGTINPIRNQQTPRDNYSLFSTLIDITRQIGGVGENRQGASGIRTATEASVVEQGVKIKTQHKVDIVADWLKKIMYKETKIIRSMVSRAGNTNYVFNIGGSAGAVDWLNFTGEDLNWIPEIEIEVHSFNKSTREDDIQKHSMALTAGSQLFPLMPNIRLDIIFKKLLKSLEVSDISTIVDSVQDQMILQAVEMAALVLGQEVPVEPNHDHAAHIRVIDMFMNSEQFLAVLQSNPQSGDLLLQHRIQHEQALQQAQELQTAQSPGPNPYESLNGSTPANVARQQTATDREAVPADPGTGGQR